MDLFVDKGNLFSGYFPFAESGFLRLNSRL